jgi:hypothetical protein
LGKAVACFYHYSRSINVASLQIVTSLFKNKLFISLVSVIVLVVIMLGIYEGMLVDTAHSTFENYYAFRGCVQLIDRTDTMGHCRTVDGQTIKIVKFHNEWYLDGDLPLCWGKFCL